MRIIILILPSLTLSWISNARVDAAEVPTCALKLRPGSMRPCARLGIARHGNPIPGAGHDILPNFREPIIQSARAEPPERVGDRDDLLKILIGPLAVDLDAQAPPRRSICLAAGVGKRRIGRLTEIGAL
jgi:hypothetical protein